MTRFRPHLRLGRLLRPGLHLASLTLLIALTLSAHADDTPQDPGRYPGAMRIVSVGGSVTEIIYALGEEHRIVARDTTSVYPPAALELPDVGYMRRLAPEGVLSVSPDLILTEPGSGPPETIDLLAEAQIPFVPVPGTYDAAGIMDRVTAVAKALGVEEKGTALVASLSAELDAVIEANAKATYKPRVLFVLSMPGGRLNVAGLNTRPDGVIKMAGAVNAVSDFTDYRILTDEAIITARPDAILMMGRSFSHGADQNALWSHPALKLTPAGQSHTLIKMDGAYLLGFGPRTAQAVSDLRRALDAHAKPKG